MSIINIDSANDLKSYLNKSKLLKNLYIRELSNSLKGEKPSKISLIIFLIKSWGFLIYHFPIVLKPRTKLSNNQKLYLSADFFYDKKLKFHKYWELVPNYEDINDLEFVYFSNFENRLWSKAKGISKSIDSYFSLKSFCKLFLITIKINYLILSVSISLIFKKINSAKYINKIYNLGTLNDYFIYFLLDDFSRHRDNISKSIYLASEFQFWELGVFRELLKNRYSFQHSGIRFNDPRILFFREKNQDCQIIVNSQIELDYLMGIGFKNLTIKSSYRKNDVWIKSTNKASKQVFFGSLDSNLDMKIFNLLPGNVSYKPHPSLLNKFKNFNKIWKNHNEEIIPIVYSQSALSKNLITNKMRCKVIFKNNFDMSLIEIKSRIEKSKNAKSRILDDYSLIEL